MSQTIALVDDERNLLTSISIALEKEGFKVQTYIDGESAFNGLTRKPPDLAIIDIKMPRMAGEEQLTKIRKKKSIPIIFLTTNDEEVDEERENFTSELYRLSRLSPSDFSHVKLSQEELLRYMDYIISHEFDSLSERPFTPLMDLRCTQRNSTHSNHRFG